MTIFLERENARIAYEVSGRGPLLVLSHGMADDRRAWRHLVPLLVERGYRVATVDLRGQGESDLGWDQYTRTASADDLIALVRELGGPAVLVGHSYSGSVVVIAATRAPDLFAGVVAVSPYTRVQRINLTAFVLKRRYRGTYLSLAGMVALRSRTMFLRYLDHSFPEPRPADHDTVIGDLVARLGEPGRMAVVCRPSTPSDADARLSRISCPVLVVNGTLDPYWPDPRAEGEKILALLPPGHGSLTMIEGAGHYAHTQYPHEVFQAMRPFLANHHPS